MQRRTFLIGSTAIATAAVAGCLTRSAYAAEVDLDGFSLAESEHPVGAVEAVTMTVPITAEWHAPYALDAIEFDILAGNSLQNIEVYETAEIDDPGSEGEDTVTVDVDLLSSWHFARSDFETDGTDTVLVAGGVEMRLVHDGETVASDYDDDAAQITVHDDGSVELAFGADASVAIDGE